MMEPTYERVRQALEDAKTEDLQTLADAADDILRERYQREIEVRTPGTRVLTPAGLGVTIGVPVQFLSEFYQDHVFYTLDDQMHENVCAAPVSRVTPLPDVQPSVTEVQEPYDSEALLGYQEPCSAALEL